MFFFSFFFQKKSRKTKRTCGGYTGVHSTPYHVQLFPREGEVRHNDPRVGGSHFGGRTASCFLLLASWQQNVTTDKRLCTCSFNCNRSSSRATNSVVSAHSAHRRGSMPRESALGGVNRILDQEPSCICRRVAGSTMMSIFSKAGNRPAGNRSAVSGQRSAVKRVPSVQHDQEI